MKLKTITLEGVTYAVLDDKGLPVYEHADGKEVGHDAVSAVNRITQLNNENAERRTKLDEATAKLATFDGIDDPVKAKAALVTVGSLDAGQLATAEQVAEIRAGARQAAEDQVRQAMDAANVEKAALEKERDDAKAALNKEMIGGNFARSKFIEDKVAIPPDFMESQFGSSFKVEDGKLVAYGADGKPIYSRTKPGELAEFDEALELIVETHPRKEHILKGQIGTGTGAQQPGDPVGGDNPWKPESLNRTKQAALVNSNPELAKRLAAQAGVTLQLS